MVSALKHKYKLLGRFKCFYLVYYLLHRFCHKPHKTLIDRNMQKTVLFIVKTFTVFTVACHCCSSNSAWTPIFRCSVIFLIVKPLKTFTFLSIIETCWICFSFIFHTHRQKLKWKKSFPKQNLVFKTKTKWQLASSVLS